MTKFDIEITSDTVCPWCYVGKKKLEAGIAAYKKAHPSWTDEFNVTWMPFQLNPTAPTPGIDKQQFYVDKFGDPARIRDIHDRLNSIGKENGIAFKFGGRIGNTRDSHRLIQLAKAKGPALQTKLVEQLFAGYFEHERDISSHDFLREAGVGAGLDEQEVEELLASDAKGPEVERELQEARRKMINSVPNFVFQDKYEIKGAQDAEGFRRVFEKLKELEAKA